MSLNKLIAFCFLTIIWAGCPGSGQTAYFADGYHGGVYGHYPMWQAKFMVDKLNENPNWKINLEIEPNPQKKPFIRKTENIIRGIDRVSIDMNMKIVAKNRVIA